MRWVKQFLSRFQRQQDQKFSPDPRPTKTVPKFEQLSKQLQRLRQMERPKGDKLFVAFSTKKGRVRVHRCAENWLRAKEVYGAVAGNLAPGRAAVLKNDGEVIMQIQRASK